MADGIEDYSWSLQDEGAARFIAVKYADRRKLYDEWQAKRKVADKSETVNGQPNPQYPRLRMEADIAQMRFEMAYLIAKNHDIEQQIDILGSLHGRVSVLEGAYTFLTMGLQTAKNLFCTELEKYSNHLNKRQSTKEPPCPSETSSSPKK